MGSRHFAAALAAGTCIMALPAQAQERTFDIPAGSVARALDMFMRQAGRPVIYRADDVRDARSPGFRGVASTEAALAAILSGTGFGPRTDQSGAIAIVRRGAAPGEEGAADDAADRRSEIVVTGTNLRGAQPTSPLITISRRAIDESGATSVEDLMRKLPQNFGGGVGGENFLTIQPGVDRSEHGEGLNLRGLGQRATLTLVNGRRLAPGNGGSFVDISLIPITAVERVEILTDGASAIYGSDAVGGVVNFILRDNFSGLETLALIGSATNGDGDQVQLGATAGHAWTGGHALVSYEYRREDEIRARDRDFTIGRDPGTFVFPRQRMHSVLGLFEQELSETLSLELSGSWASRRTELTYFTFGNPSPIGVEQEARQLNLGGQLELDLGGGWAARAEALYSTADSDNLQTRPGGSVPLNARAMRTEMYGSGLKVDGDLVDLPGGAIKLALGAEIRREDYAETYSNPAVPLRAIATVRTVRSAYGEVLVPLFSQANRRPGFERLQLSAAARYEDYGAVGSSFDPKVGLLWSPIRDLNLRASFGTSFRAPLLVESGGTFSVFYDTAATYYADPSQASGLVLFIQGYDPELSPETSRTWTLGGDFTPRFAPGLTLSANYYAIRFSNRIAQPLLIASIVGNPAFDSIVTENPGLQQVRDLIDASFLVIDFAPGGGRPEDVTVIIDGRTTNTAVTTTSGLDLRLQYLFDLGAGRATIDANANHIIDFNDRLTPQSPVISNFNTPYRPLAWRGRLGLSWSDGRFGGTLAINHAAGYPDNRAVASPRRVDSSTTLDLGASYTIGAGPLAGTRLSLFVENLFDTDPPFLAADPGFPTGSGYDTANASGRGRFVSLQLRRTW